MKSFTLAGPVDLGTLAEALRPRLARLSLLLRREQNSVLSLSLAQSTVLGQLLDGRPRRMGELATMEGVRLPTMTEIVARMEAQGWVTREMAADDRRCVDVRLTDAGRRLADQVIATRTTLIRERLEHLSQDEKASLAAALPALDRLLQGFAP